MGMLLTGHVRMDDNLADLLMKVVPARMKCNHLVHLLLPDLADHDQSS